MPKSVNSEFFIGIDLGWKEKKTSGVCILDSNPPTTLPAKSCAPRVKEDIFPEKIWCQFCQDIFGREIFQKIKPYLKETRVIAIDAPLTKGRGKGKMRLYEKFLSQKIFRKEKINPIPPALMPKLCDFAQELKRKLEKEGFVLDLNLIEVFPTMVKRISDYSQILKTPTHPPPSQPKAGFHIRMRKNFSCQTENQKSALICAILAYLHYNFQTRWLGYKDGFLFLPEMSFWKKGWRQKFYKVWEEKPYLKYRHLITNLFSKKIRHSS